MGWKIEFRIPEGAEKKSLAFATVYRPALGPTRTSLNWVLAPFPDSKAVGV